MAADNEKKLRGYIEYAKEDITKNAFAWAMLTKHGLQFNGKEWVNPCKQDVDEAAAYHHNQIDMCALRVAGLCCALGATIMKLPGTE